MIFCAVWDCTLVGAAIWRLWLCGFVQKGDYRTALRKYRKSLRYLDVCWEKGELDEGKKFGRNNDCKLIMLVLALCNVSFFVQCFTNLNYHCLIHREKQYFTKDKVSHTDKQCGECILYFCCTDLSVFWLLFWFWILLNRRLFICMGFVFAGLQTKVRWCPRCTCRLWVCHAKWCWKCQSPFPPRAGENNLP